MQHVCSKYIDLRSATVTIPCTEYILGASDKQPNIESKTTWNVVCISIIFGVWEAASGVGVAYMCIFILMNY